MDYSRNVETITLWLSILVFGAVQSTVLPKSNPKDRSNRHLTFNGHLGFPDRKG